MSAIWFEAALGDAGSDGCWELYHENSKQSRRLGVPDRRAPAAGPPSYDGFPAFALGDASEAPTNAPATVRDAMPLRALSGLLAAGARPIGGADPIVAFVYVHAVETLPRGLYFHDATTHVLRLLRRDVAEEIARSLVTPESATRAAALILLVGNLDAAAARSGERGYREALIAAGRHASTITTAATAAGLAAEDDLVFYDRDMDATLFLDGLARSVLSIVSVGTVGQ